MLFSAKREEGQLASVICANQPDNSLGFSEPVLPFDFCLFSSRSNIGLGKSLRVIAKLAFTYDLLIWRREKRG